MQFKIILGILSSLPSLVSIACSAGATQPSGSWVLHPWQAVMPVCTPGHPHACLSPVALHSSSIHHPTPALNSPSSVWALQPEWGARGVFSAQCYVMPCCGSCPADDALS